MSRRGVVLALATASSICLSPSPSRALPSYPKTHQEMDRIVASTELAKQDKVAKLKEYFRKEPHWGMVLYRIGRVDEEAARAVGLTLFRRKGTSRKHRLELGRRLLQRYKAPGFIDEYAPFLVGAVLEGGEEEFCVERERKLSAVGEYAFIASGFEGHSVEHFEKIKDKRVIPVLVKCLDAPDNVWGENSCFGGPGEPSGRNVQRQQIPVALAGLGATEAIGPLRRRLTTHDDYWLRYRSVYALAVLMDRDDSRAVEEELKASKDTRRFLFPFGRGLIEKGDDDGVRYMAFEHSIYADRKRISEVLYMVEQRLEILKGFRSRKTEGFYREALEYGPLYTILVFDDANVAFVKLGSYRDEAGKMKKITTGSEALARSRSRIIRIYDDIVAEIRGNGLTSLAPVIAGVATRTKSPEIRRTSEGFLDEIRK